MSGIAVRWRLRLGLWIPAISLALVFAGCGSTGVGSGPTETASGVPPPVTGTGTAELNWTPVTANTDGTVLTNLAGYDVYYGSSKYALNNFAQVPNPTATGYLVKGLDSGSWYFAVKAYTSDGVEGDLSNIGTKFIP